MATKTKPTEMFKVPFPVGPDERSFEIRITDHQARNQYSYSVKLKNALTLKGTKEFESQMQEAFDRMMKTLLKSGTLPQVSAEITDAESSR